MPKTHPLQPPPPSTTGSATPCAKSFSPPTKKQRRARIWRNIWRGVAVLIFLSLIFGLAEEEGKTTSVQARSEHTAVIDLTGEIGNDIDDQVQILRDSMEAAYENGNAKAIIIRANSPGGSPVVSNTAV